MDRLASHSMFSTGAGGSMKIRSPATDADEASMPIKTAASFLVRSCWGQDDDMLGDNASRSNQCDQHCRTISSLADAGDRTIACLREQKQTKHR